jgi:hypothetical protein
LRTTDGCGNTGTIRVSGRVEISSWVIGYLRRLKRPKSIDLEFLYDDPMLVLALGAALEAVRQTHPLEECGNLRAPGA